MCRVLKTDQHITNRNSFSNKMHTNSRTNRESSKEEDFVHKERKYIVTNPLKRFVIAIECSNMAQSLIL